MNKLQSVLSDEESMKQIRELADMLSGQNDDGAPHDNPPAALPAPGNNANTTQMPDIAGLLKLGSLAKESNANDKNIALLLALRPLMKDENKYKIDRAIRLLKLLNLYPAIKEIGLNGGDIFGLLG